MFRPYGFIIRPSLCTILLKSCIHSWDPEQCLQMLTCVTFDAGEMYATLILAYLGTTYFLTYWRLK